MDDPSSTNKSTSNDDPVNKQVSSKDDEEEAHDEVTESPEEDKGSSDTSFISVRFEEHVHTTEDESAEPGNFTGEDGEDNPAKSISENVEEAEESSNPADGEPHIEAASSSTGGDTSTGLLSSSVEFKTLDFDDDDSDENSEPEDKSVSPRINSNLGESSSESFLDGIEAGTSKKG